MNNDEFERALCKSCLSNHHTKTIGMCTSSSMLVRFFVISKHCNSACLMLSLNMLIKIIQTLKCQKYIDCETSNFMYALIYEI